MNLFIIDNTVRSEIVENQLIQPISGLCIDNVFLAPKKLVVEKDYGDKINFVFYNSIVEKYFKIFILQKKASSIYSRSSFEFFIIFIFLNYILRSKIEFVFDFRGLSYSEILYKNPNSILIRFKSRFLKYFEKFAYSNATKIRTVSLEFKNFLNKNFVKRSDVYVIPCCINEVIKKENLRKKNSPVEFVYLGSINKWQCFDKVCEFFKKVSSKKNSRLTVITKDISIAKKTILKFEIEANLITLSHKNILERLPEFDFGFLLREFDLVNKVASPIKFVEYIGNGVIPIISDHIGDFSSVVEINNIGLVIDRNFSFNNQKLTELLEDEDLNQRIYDTALNYTWASYFEELKKTLIIKDNEEKNTDNR